MPAEYLLEMIQYLRAHEQIVLKGSTLPVTDAEKKEVVAFLQNEYVTETANYPANAPAFDPEIAFWAAKLIFTTAQLILYRQNKNNEVSTLIPAPPDGSTPSAILSADLCLRFLPDMILQLKMIDSEDVLIPMLEDLAQKWHYSGMRAIEDIQALNFEVIAADACLQQLYTDRIIEFRKTRLAMHPAYRQFVKASLGNHGLTYWPDFTQQTSIDE